MRLHDFFDYNTRHRADIPSACCGPTSLSDGDALPRNAAGKVLETDLREPFWRGRTRGVS